MGHYEFEKNKYNVVRIHPHVYEGYEVMDVRIFAKRKFSEEWVATPRGISINIDLVPELIKGLEWALQQPCMESDTGDEVQLLSAQEEEELARTAHDLLKKHGIEVHWDMAESIVLKGQAKKFNKWQVHYILTKRRDLFRFMGDGCFKAI